MFANIFPYLTILIDFTHFNLSNNIRIWSVYFPKILTNKNTIYKLIKACFWFFWNTIISSNSKFLFFFFNYHFSYDSFYTSFHLVFSIILFCLLDFISFILIFSICLAHTWSKYGKSSFGLWKYNICVLVNKKVGIFNDTHIK